MKRTDAGIRIIFGALLLVAGMSVPAQTQDLDVPVMERADADLDTCAFGEVTGLNPDGDNFLAVRSGPGTNYRMIDKLHSKDELWLFDRKGSWIGVVYGSKDINCSPIDADRMYRGPGKAGWVHEKYVRLLAG